jgi:uncharacterized protein YutE (UPF0331/DUF86 family)
MTDSMHSVLTDKLIKMEVYLNELKGAKPDTYQKYLADKITRYGVERLLQLIIDLALDINNIILKENNKPPASDYFNSFIDLIELAVLGEDFAYNIAPSTGLRNRLVHEYDKIDNKIVYKSINKNYDYYIKYIKIIKDYIK